jgi:hypothetical protein
LSLSPLAERLTGVTNARLADEGIALGTALERVAEFAAGSALWSWGRDDHNLMGISCYIEGIAPPIPATWFGNATTLLQQAGIALDDIHALRSNTLPEHFGLTVTGACPHDALGDVRMVAAVLRHLKAAGRLDPSAMTHALPS